MIRKGSLSTTWLYSAGRLASTISPTDENTLSALTLVPSTASLHVASQERISFSLASLCTILVVNRMLLWEDHCHTSPALASPDFSRLLGLGSRQLNFRNSILLVWIAAGQSVVQKTFPSHSLVSSRPVHRSSQFLQHHFFPDPVSVAIKLLLHRLVLPGFERLGKAIYWEGRQLPFPTSDFLPGFCFGSGAIFFLRFARVWCIVGCKIARKYASQVSNELSVMRGLRVMVRQKDIVSEAFIKQIT